MTAAQHATFEGNYKLAAQRLIYARDAEPTNTTVLRLLTLAFWQAGDLNAAGRAVRDWARNEDDRPAPHRFAARIYEDMGAIDLAAEAAERAVDRGVGDADAWERLGRLRLRLMDREGAIAALEHARELVPIGRRAARPRAGLPPRRRPRRRGDRVRAGDADRRRERRRRGRATPTRWRAPTASATRSTRAIRRCDWRRIRRSPGCCERLRDELPRVLPAA